jgi:hypothetical protein
MTDSESGGGSNAGVVILIVLLVAGVVCCGALGLVGAALFGIRSEMRPVPVAAPPGPLPVPVETMEAAPGLPPSDAPPADAPRSDVTPGDAPLGGDAPQTLDGESAASQPGEATDAK